MNETPWLMWDLKTGKPTPGAGTEEAVEVLESAFRDTPASWDHPGLLHLYVHLMEMSPFPQRALRAADRLRDLVPDSATWCTCRPISTCCAATTATSSSITRRPSWSTASSSAREGAMNVYSLYRSHDHHFIVYGAMFLGQYTPALEGGAGADRHHARGAAAHSLAADGRLHRGLSVDEAACAGALRQVEEIIAQELPKDPDLYCSTTAMMLYAKGVAHSVLGQIEEAEQARAAVPRRLRARAREPAPAQQHRSIDLLAIGEEMLTGELEYRRGNFDLAFAHLRRAVELDDSLPYDEPWGWMQPTAPCTGRAAAGAGPSRRGRGGLPRRSRLRRQDPPRLLASRECLEPARPPRMPRPARRRRSRRR